MQGETTASILTWAAAAAALLAVGPVVGWLAGWTATPDGSALDSVFTSERPVLAALATALAVALVAALGLVVRHPLTKRYALFSMGLALFWLAFSSPRLETLVYEAPPEAALTRLALDAVFLLLLILPAVALVLSGDRPTGRFAHHKHTDPDPAPITDSDSIFGLVAAAIAALLGAWLVAQSGLRGQTLAAALAGGILAGGAVRLVFQRAQPIVPVAGVLLAGVAAPLIARFSLPADALAAVYAGDVFNAARLAPADWAVGALAGVAAGQYFALSLIDHSPHHEHATKPAAKTAR